MTTLAIRLLGPLALTLAVSSTGLASPGSSQSPGTSGTAKPSSRAGAGPTARRNRPRVKPAAPGLPRPKGPVARSIPPAGEVFTGPSGLGLMSVAEILHRVARGHGLEAPAAAPLVTPPARSAHGILRSDLTRFLSN
jgi:hypothetical protein